MRKIRLSKSVLDNREVEAIRRTMLEDEYLGMGKDVELFEKQLQKFLKANRQVICVNSGTAALHSALMA